MSGMLDECVAVTPDADKAGTLEEEVDGTLDAVGVAVPTGGEFAFEHPKRMIDANKANPSRIACSSKNQGMMSPSGQANPAAMADHACRSMPVVNWASRTSLLPRAWPSPRQSWEQRVGPT